MTKTRLVAPLAAVSALVAGVLLAPSMALGQVAAAAKAKAAGTAHSDAMLRTPDGQPDLQGIWSYATLTPLERPSNLAGKEFFTEKEAADYEKDLLTKGNRDRRDGGIEADVSRAYNELWYDSGSHVVKTRRTSLVIDPPDGRIPALTPAAQQREAARAQDRRNRGGDPADSWEDRNLGERCITRGAPKLSGGYNNNVQIFQAPGYVAIQQEMIHETRIIPLDQRPHLPSNIRLWLGDSRGHWEGNTLVVDTTNYTGKIISNSFNCCRGSGENLHVIERFTRLDADTIDYQFTVDDPSTYTKPWTVSLPMSKTDGPLYEYACHEGNYGMENLLKGARALEKAASEAKK
jgi:hypothetical protein